jgi:hypothetical protein
MNSYDECKAIVELDLDPIKVKLMHKESGEGWTAPQASAVESEYRRFLYLIKMFPDEDIAPRADVDIFWHYHILDTRKYAQDCDALFGHFLHHFPYLGLDEDDHHSANDAAARTSALYRAAFGDGRAQAQRAGEAANEAFCSVTAAKSFCSMTGEKAFCSVTAAKSFCSVTGEKAFCSVTAKRAFCSVTAANAFCSATAPDSSYAASPATSFCSVTAPKAFCSVTSNARDKALAFCSVTAVAARAFCSVTSAPPSARPAFCSVTAAARETAAPAFCSVTASGSPTSAPAFCSVTAQKAFCSVNSAKDRGPALSCAAEEALAA